ncbi:response regulator [Skermanella pratensis]|uniref:response regulator n=1 Tax=Skermanella pratensis TaxID=2233999 RepID=UPI001FE86615|nr:response regulator [Skermanella pratensis]
MRGRGRPGDPAHPGTDRHDALRRRYHGSFSRSGGSTAGSRDAGPPGRFPRRLDHPARPAPTQASLPEKAYRRRLCRPGLCDRAIVPGRSADAGLDVLLSWHRARQRFGRWSDWPDPDFRRRRRRTCRGRGLHGCSVRDAVPDRRSRSWAAAVARPVDLSGRLRPWPDHRPAEEEVPDPSRENSRFGLRSLRRLLERAGHTLLIAEDGNTALDLLHKGGLDVMLLDVQLRNPNALDLVRMYRFMRSEDAHLPIVGLVPGLTDPARKRCIAAGMNEVLPVPVEEFRLLEAVDRLGAAALSAREALETGVVASISAHPRFSTVAEPCIDEDALDALQSLDPDNGFLEDVIAVFLADGAELIDAMVKALNEGDVISFRDHADSLGSSSTHIGAIRLVKLLARCRDMPTRGFREEGNQKMLQIQDEFRRVRTALQSHVWTLHHSNFN